WSPNGSYLAIGTNNARLMIWEIASQSLLHQWDTTSSNVYDVAWSPDSTQLIASSGYHSLEVWDIVQLLKVSSYPSDHSSGAVAWSPDGKQIAYADYNQLYILPAPISLPPTPPS